jgi:hypothetical protein
MPRTARAVAAMPPGAVAVQRWVQATGDFLATRAVELAVHHLDLGRELDLAPPAPSGLRLAHATVESLLGGALPSAWSDEAAVLVGAGRVDRMSSSAMGSDQWSSASPSSADPESGRQG